MYKESVLTVIYCTWDRSISMMYINVNSPEFYIFWKTKPLTSHEQYTISYVCVMSVIERTDWHINGIQMEHNKAKPRCIPVCPSFSMITETCKRHLCEANKM